MIHAENRLAPRMVLIITNHEYRRKLEQTFQNFRIPIYYQCQGHGTAPSEMLEELLKPDYDDIFLSLIGNYQPDGTPIGPVDIRISKAHCRMILIRCENPLS